MKYIIMADGKGTRWNNYNDIPKHFIEVNGETLIGRCIRLIHENDDSAQVIVTSHDKRYDLPGAERYEPLNNVLEIDRFTEELIADNVVFLYGDTYYSEEAMRTVTGTEADDILFFGNPRSIVAVKVKDGELFRSHVHNVRQLYLDGRIQKCIGWQVYQSFTGLPFGEKQIGENFVVLEDGTKDYNSPEDLDQR